MCQIPLHSQQKGTAAHLNDSKLQINSWKSAFQMRRLSKCLVRQLPLLGQFIKAPLNPSQALQTIQSS